MPSLDRKIGDKIDDWKRRLLDLTRRNPALFFRPERQSNLEVIAPESGALLARLLDQEKTRSIYLPPIVAKEDDPDDDVRATDAATSFGRLPSSDELVFKGKDGGSLRKRLKSLHRLAHADFEERALQTLYLAVGLLHWSEGGSEQSISPLLMVPVVLVRDPAKDTYSLGPADDDPVVNPSLQAKLSAAFRISLPQLPDDWDADQLHSWLGDVRAVVRPFGWDVSETLWLARFSFHKLAIYQDISAHAEQIGSHSIIRAIAGDENLTDRDGEFCDERELDSRVRPHDSFTVLDADSSQLVVVDAVSRGLNVVVQGPPGTGKSQTIVNLIAQLIATGKTVLFVSEKIAALEVVHARLKAAGLDRLVHELHSHKANKREVVEELHRSLTKRKDESSHTVDHANLDRLVEKRGSLNSYAETVGVAHGDMHRPLYYYLGELAALDEAPHIPFPDQIGPISDALVAGVVDAAKRLATVWVVASAGRGHPWFGVRSDRAYLDSKVAILSVLEEVARSVKHLRREGARVSEALGTANQQSLDDLQMAHHLAEAVDDAPDIRQEWLTIDERVLSTRLADGEAAFAAREAALAQLASKGATAGIASPAVTAESWRHEVEALKALFGTLEVVDHVLSTRREAIAALDDDCDTLAVALDDAGRFCTELGVARIDSRVQISLAAELVISAGASVQRPLTAWFEPQVLRGLQDGLDNLRRDVVAAATARHELLAVYEPGVFDLDVDATIAKLVSEFRSPLRFFNRDYRATMRGIRAVRRDGKTPKNLEGDLRNVRETLRAEGQVALDHMETIASLGERYRGAATDFQKVEQSLGLVASTLGLGPGLAGQIGELVGGRRGDAHAIVLAEKARAALLDIERLAIRDDSTCLVAALETLAAGPTADSLNTSLEGRRRIRTVLGSVDSYLSFIEASQNSATLVGVDEIVRLLDEHKSADEASVSIYEYIVREFGPTYASAGVPSWPGLKRIASWLRNRGLVAKFSNPVLLKRLAAHEVSGPVTSRIQDEMTTFSGLMSKATALWENVDGANVQSLRSNELNEIERICHDLVANIDRLSEWWGYREVARSFVESGLGSLLDALAAAPSLDAATLPDVAKRSILHAFVARALDASSILRAFSGETQADTISEFRALDERFIATNARRVREMVASRQPQRLVAHSGSEARVLLTEHGKKKKHLPIRKLFAKIPELLQQLKPCLLMSPLSVSQFLDSESLTFDCVIFDEASQICSEDAISAIYRGRQLVVCGDKKQLPPTAFFNEADTDDDAIDEEGDVAVFESILAEAETAGFLQRQLSWHYRSAHESLIAFSNERFYSGSLITFPSNISEAGGSAVRFRFVPDGVYDRGGRRDNRIEADAVVGEVLRHIESTPLQSLGVVAFSSAQADAIQNRIDILRKSRPDLAEFFSDERLNGFFVKNLERVQGDERDHIIFSIGYGRDKNGLLTMNFGPVGKPGGEKRLNVAVTRARQNVTVVSSIKAGDIDLDRAMSPGALGLHKYLDYAERGYVALDLHLNQGEYESPFEEDVAGAIRSLGYSVVSQVGVSSFRVDLGVKDPARPGRFLLGVECDGAMYHSSYTARDRDRLRQEILEQKMGWKIYRIWSPDWVKKRGQEIERLRRAIEEARVLAESKIGGYGQSLVAPVKPTQDVSNEYEPLAIVEPFDARGEWTEPYLTTKIVRRPVNCEFHDPAAFDCIRGMIAEVVAFEGPVHREVVAKRVARRWNLARVGARMVDVLRRAEGGLVRGGSIVLREKEFLDMPESAQLERVRVPVAGNEETLRLIDHVPAVEIAVGVKCLLSEAGSFEEAQLVTQLTRAMGYDRTGSTIKSRISRVIDSLVRTKHIAREADRIFLIEPAV